MINVVKFFPNLILNRRRERGINMEEQGLEGVQPVDQSKHPSGIIPTLQ